MNRKPKCIIVTGRPGSGKTTLAKKLGERLWMPVISRDEIKEGYINTCGSSHDELPHDTNRLVTGIFFGIVNQYLAGNISVVLDAAFQHNVWESRMPEIRELASTSIVLCSADESVSARRQLERALHNSKWDFYHGAGRMLITGRHAKSYLLTVIQSRNSMYLQFESRRMDNAFLVLMRL